MAKFLFIGDRLSTLKLSADTSLALAEAALDLNFQVHWCESWQIGIFGTEIMVETPQGVESVSTEKIVNFPLREKLIHLSGYEAIFIRKDPPFDEEYKDFCWILASQCAVPIYNSAQALLNYHEKALPFLAIAKGVLKASEVAPTCVTASVEMTKLFCEQQELNDNVRFLVKPWLGFGGRGIEIFENSQSLLDSLKTKSNHLGMLPQRVIIQPFLPEIFTEGDRRILVSNGQILCDFVRFPAPGNIASNLAQGGTAQLIPMTANQKSIAQNLANFLKHLGISFAGIDMIGSKIGEINITSPTGIRTFEKLAQTNVRNSALRAILNSAQEFTHV